MLLVYLLYSLYGNVGRWLLINRHSNVKSGKFIFARFIITKPHLQNQRVFKMITYYTNK